jgi:GAF domain/PilZ domain
VQTNALSRTEDILLHDRQVTGIHSMWPGPATWGKERAFSMNSENVIPDRRNAVRHKMRAPVFAIFDGVSSGMILDLSEQGLSMLATVSPEKDRPIPLKLSLSEPSISLETTGYVAWADTFGRAGIRFSDLPVDARLRLEEWLTINAGKPSHKAPKFTLDESLLADLQSDLSVIPTDKPRAIEFEAESTPASKNGDSRASTVQFEFNSMGTDIDAALQVIAERARALTRATGAALALASNGFLTCRASVGSGAPALGATVDVNNGFSGGCVRIGKTLRCDDTQSDPRVDATACNSLGVRSIVASPIQYERQIVGLLEVFSTQPFAFDEGDVAVIERLGRTALPTMSQNAAPNRFP